MAVQKFRILTVCTGNICRSPAAERLLQAALGDEVEVSSAGVAAVVGGPIHPEMRSLLEQSRVAADGFAARQFTPADIQSADLVLALSREHRFMVVEEVPAALRRSYTLLEFARIVTSPEFPPLPADGLDARLRSMVTHAARYRSRSAADEDDDVPDPYGREPEAYQLSYRLIRDAVDRIAAVAHQGSQSGTA